MPVYTVINKTNQEHTEVFCSWNELQEMLKDDNLTQNNNLKFQQINKLIK